MKRELYLCTFSEHALDVIKENGIGIEFNQFCISSTLDEGRMERAIAAMEKEYDICGIEDHSRAIVHGPFTEIIPMAIDHLFVDLCHKRLDQAAEGTKMLGLNRMVAHTGYYPTIYMDPWHIKQSTKFWSEFIEKQPDDFQICIENVFDPDPYPMLDVLKNIGDPRVKLCLDVGHAHCVSKIPVLEWIKLWGPHIAHFHLHNNDGTGDQHNEVMDGTLDMEEVLRAIDDYCPPEATLTCESRKAVKSIPWLLERLK